MMEIGSFIELQMPKGLELYRTNAADDMEVARLNSGRAAIYHAFTVTRCNSIWLPYYQCDSVFEFMKHKQVNCKFYHIDSDFNPISLTPGDDEAVLLVNYYGIMSFTRMSSMAKQYKNIIIDNSQAFFARPLENCLNVYSARKFIGVPDGAYVIGMNAAIGLDAYEQGYSSDTALYMLQRIEYGCEGKAYASRVANENRIDNEDCKLMSKLTRYILDGTDYEAVEKKRKDNFMFAHALFGEANRLNVLMYFDEKCVPMVYPLLIEDKTLLDRLLKAKHFQGHWWKSVEENSNANVFEKWISSYMVPITIDQRYGEKELLSIASIVFGE